MDAGHADLGLQLRGRRQLSLNARQIGEIIGELTPILAGRRLAEVQALPPRDLLLIFEGTESGGGPPIWRLRVSADADASRLHLQQGRQKRAKGPEGPFFRRLSAELVGAELRRIDQVRGDRIALFEFGATPSGERRALLAELTGRHSNLVLLGRDDAVVDLLVSAPKSREAPRLVVGRPWTPPPGRGGRPEDLPSIVDELEEPDVRPPAVDAGHPFHAPLSWRVEVQLGGEAADRDSSAARRDLRKRLERKRKGARGLVSGLEKQLANAADAERVRRDGDLLTANLHRMKRGMKSIELEDWYEDGSPARRIELDPKLDPAANAQRLFERSKRLERSLAEVPGELERARKKLDALESAIDACRDDDCDADGLETECIEAGLLEPRQIADPRKRKEPVARLPYRAFRAAHGSEIRVGRTARDNDALTFRHANGNDLWLHTSDCPGSHVILRTEGKGDPDQEDVLDAAHLAVHFSPLRGAGKASVHVARRKEVHKPRGAKAGLVTLAGGKKLDLRLQPERLQRLLEQGRDR
ncbi:MAG: NFACT family protein [Planctomycetes bacterium]|nr:NFACT family protein [Planctomycetota bacterium]